MKNTWYDVIIYGQTASAVGAALHLLEQKRRILLVLPGASPATEITETFLTALPKGISQTADKLIPGLRKTGAYRNNHTDPALFLLHLMEHLNGADILFYTRPAGIVREGNTVKALLLAGKTGIFRAGGSCFIDASDNLEIFRLLAPESCRETPCDSVFTFSMELDSNIPAAGLREERLFAAGASIWDTERNFKIRNGSRASLRKIVTRLRKTYGEFQDALLTRASFAPQKLAAASLQKDSPFRNLLASPQKAVFQFEDHDLLSAVRMKEGEELGTIADCLAASFPENNSGEEIICAAAPSPEPECDILVCGGGVSGAVAAIAAGRSGQSVQLWEALDCLGGTGTSGAIPGYYYGIPGGLQDEIDNRTGECSRLFYGRHLPPEKRSSAGFHEFHPLAKMTVLEEMAQEAGVRVGFNRIVCSVETETGKAPRFPAHGTKKQPPAIVRLKAVNAVSPAGPERCSAKTFIDATGDADVAMFCGAEFDTGREADAIQHIYSVPALKLLNSVEKDPSGNVRRSYLSLVPHNSDSGYMDACDPRDVSRARRSGLLAYMLEKYRKAGRVLFFSMLPGARASRQISGDYQLKFSDLLRASEFPDVIAYSVSHYDSHATDYENESLNALIWNWALEGHDEPIGCEIPYRTMLPFGIENLIVACRSLSVEYDAGIQFRMQRDMQRIGEAAGLAAAAAIKENVEPRYINVRDLQRELAASGALLEPESNYHCDSWKGPRFYPDRRIFELTEKGFAPSRELMSGGVTGYIQLENDLKSKDRGVKFAAAVKLAAGAHLEKANELLPECIQSRCARPSPITRNSRQVPLWKIAVAICGANSYLPARKAIEDILTDEHCIGDQQALILAVRALGKIGDIHSAEAIDLLLRRGDVAHTQEFSQWSNGQPVTDDSAWKLELAGFEAMCTLGLEKREFLEKYADDPRGYVRRAAERVKERIGEQ